MFNVYIVTALAFSPKTDYLFWGKLKCKKAICIYEMND